MARRRAAVDAVTRGQAYPVTPSQAGLARRELARRGCVVVSGFIPESLRDAVAAETVQLAGVLGVRRDLEFAETGFSPRRMSNVTQSLIVEHGVVIPQVYESDWLLHVLSSIAGEPLFPCPYEPERFVITRLEQPGDTHGWHWDDYGFALVWVAESPDPADGGFVEGVPDTIWDKQRPGIEEILRSRRAHRLDLSAGDVYLMRTDTTLHRVYPIRRGRRTIVNMAFARHDELCRPTTHETMDALWSPPGTE
ncbi:HalD/BesD family halogenase [Nocardia asteroides]